MKCKKCDKGDLSVFNYGNDTTECSNARCDNVARGDIRDDIK